MSDNESGIACCLRATDDDIAADPEAYQCGECEYHQQICTLGQRDLVALELHQHLASRAVQELHLVPLVFDAYGFKMSRQEVDTLLRRLEVIHHHRCPPPKTKTGSNSGDD